MNEQQNTELIKAMYAAFARGNVAAILGALTEDVEWILEGPAIIPFSGSRRGRAEVAGFFEGLATTQVNQKLTIDTWVAQGEVVATMGRYAATVKANGRSFDASIAHFFTFRGGKVSKFVDFGDTALMAETYAQASAAAR